MPSEPLAPFDLDTICALSDPVLRNLLITQRYHDLSHALRDVIEPARPSNANWSTFATWASKTAGETIRDEEVPKAAMALIADAEEVRDGLVLVVKALHALHLTKLDVPDLLAPVEKTIRDLSDQIAVGNLKVFRELAPVFASFVETFRDAKSTDGAALDRFVDALQPGDVASGGQELLREAFRGYFQARFAIDDETRAQTLLACNCQIGLHEQTRLQPQIQGALDAPIDDVLRDGIHRAAKKFLPFDVHGRIADAIAAPLDPVLAKIARVWRRVATRHLMNLTLPLDDRLPLGADLRTSFGEPIFPAPLQRLSGPPQLLDLVARFDRARPVSDVGDVDEGTAALDWASLDDRMNFILNLFRSRQQDATLFDEPFSDDDRKSIDDYRTPSGRL